MGSLLNHLKNNTLFRVIVACFIVGKIHLFFDGDAAWYVYAAGLIAQQMIAFMVLFSYISYEKLKNKTLAAMLCVFPVLEIALLFVSNPYGKAFAVISTLSVLWLIWSVFRRYDTPSDVIDSKYVYTIAKAPDNLVTFLASVAGKPFGKYSYYVDGIVYYYHHDKLKEIDAGRFNMDEATIIQTSIIVTDKTKERFAKMVGTKWSFFLHNCITLRWKVQSCQKKLS